MWAASSQEGETFGVTMRIAVPVRGVGCIALSLMLIFIAQMSCRPREGCGLHRFRWACVRNRKCGVAVPVRGAGCIWSAIIDPAYEEEDVVAVPVRGAGCISKSIQPVLGFFGGSSQPASSL